jgi:amino acid adenylation domain-containing protein
MSVLKSDVSARRSKLTPEQLALLEKRLRGQAAVTDVTAPESIGRRPLQERPPLSFAQQRLWFLDQLDPGNSFYNVPRALRFKGPINRPALEQSLTEITRRHEALRTTFPSDNGEPVQVIGTPGPVRIPLVDLCHLADDERENAARQIAASEAATGFDLALGPLLRVVVIRLSAEDNLVLLTMHHIVTDGWSMGVLIKEVTTLYDSFSRGRPSPLPELQVQYADFSYWQQQRLRGEELEKHLGYWRRQLGDAPTELDLPTTWPRPLLQSHRGASQQLRIPKSLADALKTLGRHEGTTTFMTLLAAFNVLLYRYTNQSDILVGTPIANRNHEELEALIGFFVNTLVLRTSFTSASMTFREALRQVRETTLGAYAHQDLPFERLVEELQPERNLSRTPLFQVMFILQNVPSAELQLSGLTLSAQDVYTATAKFDLSWTAIETEQGIMGSIEYNSDIFSASAIELMSGHLLRLAASFVANPDARISDLPMLSEAEQKLLLEEWNDTTVERGVELCAHRMFEQQVKLTPDGIAVVFEEQQLNYSELNRRANQLAHHLRELGVGPESHVAISLERSVEMLVALVGVLKSGAAYVPIDPAYPMERKAFMLEDSLAEVVIIQSEADAPAFNAERTRFLCLDAEQDAIARQSDDNLSTGVEPHNLAYIIYTSGSTGRPKGIGLPHLALTNLIEWHRETLSNKARTMQFASLSFDASFHEMFAAWTTGGTLFLIPEMIRMDPSALAAMIDEHEIEKIILPVVMLQEIARERADSKESLNSLKEIITTGEQLQLTGAIRKLFERLHDCTLHNHYGPSETHVVTAYNFDRAASEWPSLPPIGKPISNTRVYVLDEHQRLVPTEVYGEIYIGGDCLARGYFERPELTAERFIPDPYSLNGGDRLYRTGDVGRYLSDGNIEYVGRRDNQVKIRGFRVELGEVEAALARQAFVREVVVIVREDTVGDKRLVAYVVTDSGMGEQAVEGRGRSSEPTLGEMRATLGEHLPDYMIPSAFVMLDALPLTPNGKIDRRALPAPDGTRDALKREYVAPRNRIEEDVVGIWEQVLGVERVGVEDNFFELGGHSLKATQVVSRLQKLHGDRVRLRDLFATPTVRGLAEKIVDNSENERGRAEQGPQTSSQTSQITRIEDRDYYDVSSAQRRVWIVCQQREASRAYNLPKSFVLEGEVDEKALRRAVRSLVERHESLRTRFIVVAGEPKQKVEGGEGIELQVVDLSREGEGEEFRQEKAREIARQEAREVFDLERGPLMRARLLKITDERHVFMLTLHHIIADGWSLNVLTRELMQLYHAYRKGLENPLPELEIQYRDYADWEKRELSGARMEEQQRYWREKLGGEIEAVRIEGDAEGRAQGGQYLGEVVHFEISDDETESLRRIGREHGASLYMSLLAAVYALLHRYSGQEDLVVACPVSGRKQQELENQVGMYLNTLLLRTETRGTMRLGELLERVKETALGAFENQEYPYEQLARELKVKREPGQAPLMEVVVTLAEQEGGVAMEDAVATDVGIRGWGESSGVSKNDLWFGFQERGKGLTAAINYNSDKYRDESIAEIAASLTKILRQLAVDVNARVMDLELGDENASPAGSDGELDIELSL